MPGMDYLLESGQYRDNFFAPENFMTQLGVELGVGMAAPFGIRQYAERVYPRRMQAADTEYWRIQARPTQRTKYSGPKYGLSRKERRLAAKFSSKSAQATKSLTSSMGYAKHLGKIGIAAGVASTFVFAYDAAKMLGQWGETFRGRVADRPGNRQYKVYDEDSYFDSRAAFTQRQRALQVIHNSQLGVRAALGSESNYLHY